MWTDVCFFENVLKERSFSFLEYGRFF